jgi:hypothetical protein
MKIISGYEGSGKTNKIIELARQYLQPSKTKGDVLIISFDIDEKTVWEKIGELYPAMLSTSLDKELGWGNMVVQLYGPLENVAQVMTDLALDAKSNDYKAIFLDHPDTKYGPFCKFMKTLEGHLDVDLYLISWLSRKAYRTKYPEAFDAHEGIVVHEYEEGYNGCNNS